MPLGRMEVVFVLCIGMPYKINERKSINNSFLYITFDKTYNQF